MTKKVQVSQEVFDGMTAARESGEYNMFDRVHVSEWCYLNDHPRAAEWIDANQKEYGEAIFNGIEVKDPVKPTNDERRSMRVAESLGRAVEDLVPVRDHLDAEVTADNRLLYKPNAVYVTIKFAPKDRNLLQMILRPTDATWETFTVEDVRITYQTGTINTSEEVVRALTELQRLHSLYFLFKGFKFDGIAK